MKSNTITADTITSRFDAIRNNLTQMGVVKKGELGLDFMWHEWCNFVAFSAGLIDRGEEICTLVDHDKKGVPTKYDLFAGDDEDYLKHHAYGPFYYQDDDSGWEIPELQFVMWLGEAYRRRKTK